VACVENNDVARAVDGLKGQHGVGRGWGERRGSGQNGRKVVDKSENLVIGWIFLSPRPLVSGTEIAGGIVVGKGGRLGSLDLAEPWTLGAMWGYKDVFLQEGVVCVL
jgi:hypothetical protein